MSYPCSTFTTSRALTYFYIHIPPRPSNTQYILFLHGFPSTSRDWRHQISFFAAKGYGVLAPDLLGFGETSKPSELEKYKSMHMTGDIIEIMDKERIEVAVGVAHDWGSFLLSRLANYNPKRFSAYIFIDHGYIVPGQGLKTEVIKNVNDSVQASLGFSIFGYFLFFDEDDASSMMDKHSESVESLYFTSNDTINKKYKGAPGGLRSWLTQGKTTDLPSFLTWEDHKHYQNTFSLEKGGYGPATNWYRASLRNINGEDEDSIPSSAHILTHPTLLIGSTEYFITVTVNYPERMKAFVPDLTVVKMNGGHWLQLEKADEVNTIMEEFMNKKS